MPQSTEELLSLLDLEVIEDGLFRGRQPETSLQRVFGGQVASQALVAAARTVEADRVVHSLHAYFLLPGDTSVPILYDTERTRDGRAFSSRRVVARQHGRAIFNMYASFQVPEEGLEHQDEMPEVAPPGECPELGDVLAKLSGRSRENWDREWSSLDVRYAGELRVEPGERREPVSRVWLKSSEAIGDDPVLHAAVLTYASDLTLLSAALMPHGTHIGDPRLQPASLDHAMWFHRPFRADEWWLYDQWSPSAHGGRGLAFGHVYTSDGTLVATAAQEGVIRSRRPG